MRELSYLYILNKKKPDWTACRFVFGRKSKSGEHGLACGGAVVSTHRSLHFMIATLQQRPPLHRHTCQTTVTPVPEHSIGTPNHRSSNPNKHIPNRINQSIHKSSSSPAKLHRPSHNHHTRTSLPPMNKPATFLSPPDRPTAC